LKPGRAHPPKAKNWSDSVQDDSGPQSILTVPLLYRMFKALIGSAGAQRWVMDNFWRIKPGQKIVDIGCGPGTMIDLLPDGAKYVGFDISDRYIEYAKRKYPKNADIKFLVGEPEKFALDTPAEMQDADLAVINGVLHHLDDQQATTALRLARKALKPTGRLVCLENCFLLRQSPIARWIISRDRGRNIRTEPEWKALVAGVFPDFATYILTGHIRIPYTHIIIEAHP
jgi:SAM-dependent methyltransferase